MTVSFKVGDISITSGSPDDGSIELSEIKDHTGVSGSPGQFLGRDLTGLFWSDLPQASSSLAGIVQLTDSTSSTSTTTASTPNSVKSAFDLADGAIPKNTLTSTGDILYASSPATVARLGVGAAGQVLTVAGGIPTWAAPSGGSTGPLTSDVVLYVNATDGNDATAARGTDRPYATITAALAAASEGDTIFLSAGTFTENFTITKGVHLAGTFSDMATWSGTKILGNVTVTLTSSAIRNLAVSDIYFISANSTSPVSVTNVSTQAGGINTFTNCMFSQQNSSDTTQFAFQTSGTWGRSLYLRQCTVDGNLKHNAGTAAGASGYMVIDSLLGIGNNVMYHSIMTGTVEYRNPSNSVASILHTGGTVIVNNASSGITPNGAATTSVFGGTGFSYKGTAASAGTTAIFFSGGSNQGTGKVDIGANVVYSWTNLAIDPANLTVNVAAIPYTTAVPSSANAQSLTQQRPRLDLLRTPSVVTAANRLDMVVDSTSGVTYSVTPIWLPLVTQTLTTTTPTTVLTLPIASFRGATVSISVSDVTGGRFYNDTWMVIHNGTTTNTQLASPGARIGSSPYTLTSTISGANLLVQVTSASTNSTKYVGYYQTFAV